MNQKRITRLNNLSLTVGALGLLPVLPLLTGCDYAQAMLQNYGQAVLQNIGFGVRDCVNEAGLTGCLVGGDPVELVTGALINGAIYGVQ